MPATSDLPKPSYIESPYPPALMDFPSAMAAVRDGKCITKVEWANRDFYGELREGKLMIHLAAGWHQWIISDGDLAGQDWFIL